MLCLYSSYQLRYTEYGCFVALYYMKYQKYTVRMQQVYLLPSPPGWGWMGGVGCRGDHTVGEEGPGTCNAHK